jgi:hypothetical protein
VEAVVDVSVFCNGHSLGSDCHLSSPYSMGRDAMFFTVDCMRTGSYFQM